MSHMRAGQESTHMARKKGESVQIVGGSVRTVPIYSAFALIYDEVMSHVPFENWARYLASQAGRRQHLLDLACGTGKVLQTLLQYTAADTIGIDSSEPMLAIARRRLKGQAEIRPGNLTRIPVEDASADWAICTHDSINYLMTEGQLTRHFKEVFRVLEPGGIYSFDAVTEQNMITEFDGQVREEMIDGILLRWSNRYERDRRVLVSHLVFQDGSSIQVEMHEQQYYDSETILSLASRAGFETGPVHGDYEDRPLRARDAFMNFNCTKPL